MRSAMHAAAWVAGLALCSTGVLGQFPTPASPAVPADIEVAAVETCTNAFIAMAYGPDWASKNGDQTLEADKATFVVKAWGVQFFYTKTDVALPPLKKGLQYEVSFELKLQVEAGGTQPELAQDPGLMLWKETAKNWDKLYVWPVEYAKDKPDDIVGGAERSMGGTASTDGFTKYSVGWTAQQNTNDPRQKLWVHMTLKERPKTPRVSYILRNFCVRRVAKTVPPPPALASYTEKFVFVRPAQPSAAELTQQSGCPFEEAGLQTWESVFGTKTTGTLELPANAKVVVGAQSFVAGARYTKIVVPATSELIFRDEAVALTVKAVVVQGKLRIGSETCRMQGPIKMTFWGQRGDPATDLDGFGSKGLAVTGSGEVDMFGRRFFPTWVRLARQARAGDDRVYLQEAVNWYPGQEVAVLTTIPDDTGKGQPHQNEVMTVKAVGGAGRVVQFTAELAYNHYAGTEYQGEVALLSRRIMLEGEPDADGYGAHFVVAGKRGRVAGVASRYMGQTNIMARYPFHFHLLGADSGSYFSDNVARDTYFRCFTIHGTHGVLVSENVAFNATGSCYYVEDGVEENNTVSYNMAAHVKPVGEGSAGSAQGGEVILQDVNPGGLTSGQRLQPADASATGFYFSNAYNSIVGNVASGGWSGFGFPGFPAPIGHFRTMDTLEPRARPLKEFRGNTAHSAGWYWGAGGAVYVGGELRFEDDSKTRLRWLSGRMARNTRVEKEPGYQNWEGTPLWMRFENTLVYASNKGLLHWGSRVDVDGFEFHDVARSVTLFGEAWLGNGIVNGASGNLDAGYEDLHHDGFQFYDISVKSVVTGVEFRNYQKATCRQVTLPGNTNWPKEDSACAPTSAGNLFNVIWSGLYHSDEFKPQQISAVNKITYKNVDKDLLVGLKIVETGASRFFNFIDFDGSATMEGRPTIVGSNLDWWNVCSDCRFEAAWQTWLCPKKPANYEEREVAHIKVQTPDISPSNGGIGKSGVCQKGGPGTWDWSNCNVGYVALWKQGSADTRVRKSTITQNAGMTGVSGTGWYMRLDGGAPKKFTVAPEQIPNKATLRFAVSYPSGTKFTVTAAHKWDSRLARTLTLAASLDEVIADPIGKYYFDNKHLYMRLLVPDSVDWGRFERGGAWVYDTFTAYTITVVADCAANGKGFCSTATAEDIPVWDTPCPDSPTLAPPTLVPATSAPATGMPPSASPPTDAPIPRTAWPGIKPTDAPPTDVPATDAPSTRVPATPAPSGVPVTPPPTSVPRTPAPATAAGSTGVPRTSHPSTFAPPSGAASVVWCTSDAVCRAHGDTSATCSVAENSCVCSSGFNSSGSPGVCASVGQSVAVASVVEIVWQVDCALFQPDYVTLLEELLKEVLKASVRDVKVVCGSATLTALAEGVPATSIAAVDLAQEVTVRQASDPRYTAMHDTIGNPASALLTLTTTCSQTGASVAWTNSNNECVASSCIDGYTLVGGQCVADSSGDSGLSHGEIAAIVVCVTLVVAVAAGVAIYCCKRQYTPQDTEEPHNAKSPSYPSGDCPPHHSPNHAPDV